MKCIQNFWQQNLKNRNRLGVYRRAVLKRICIKRNAVCRVLLLVVVQV